MTILNAKVLLKTGPNKAGRASKEKTGNYQAGREGVKIHGTVRQATNFNKY